MYYGIEKAADMHRADLIRDAEQRRLVEQCASQPRSFRRPLGNLLVRVGSRLNEEPRHQPQLASVGDVA